MSRRRPQYPLDKLLDARRREEREWYGRLARARQELGREEQRLRALEAKRRSHKPMASTAAQLQAEERRAQGLRRRIADQREARRRAAETVDRAAGGLTHAKRRREVVEKDRAGWERQQRRTSTARDQRDAEEAGRVGFRKPRS